MINKALTIVFVFIKLSSWGQVNELENLKKNSINNKTDYIIGNHNYYFNSLRKDPFIKSLENNVNYSIAFYGLYDYKLSNFVSFYIQPFIFDTTEYVVYYSKLNGQGTYNLSRTRSRTKTKKIS